MDLHPVPEQMIDQLSWSRIVDCVPAQLGFPVSGYPSKTPWSVWYTERHGRDRATVRTPTYGIEGGDRVGVKHPLLQIVIDESDLGPAVHDRSIPEQVEVNVPVPTCSGEAHVISTNPFPSVAASPLGAVGTTMPGVACTAVQLGPHPMEFWPLRCRCR